MKNFAAFFQEGVTEDAIQLIRQNFPNATVQDAGKVGAISRFVIDIGNGMKFNAGENLHFIMNGVLAKTLKSLPLVSRKEVAEWLKNEVQPIIKSGLQQAPPVMSHSRKWLGQETKFEKHPKGHQTMIHYPKFVIIVTGHSISMAGAKTKRVFTTQSFKDPAELDAIFKSMSFYAQSIDQLDVT